MDAYLKINEKEYNEQIIINTGYFEIFGYLGSYIHESNKIIEGVYETDKNIDNTQILKSKIVIKEITKEEFELKNKNTLRGIYNNQYISIEFYIYIDELNDFIDTSIQNISYNTYGYIRDIEFILDEKWIVEFEGYLGHK